MSNKEFLLSYIVPAYNAENVLEPCVNSIIQIGDAVEVIIVNDGSYDCTCDIARELYNKYPDQIKVIDQENQGVSAARNAGISSARGRYIAFSDADDTVNTAEVRRIVSNCSLVEDVIMFNYTAIENGKEEDQPLFPDLFSDNSKEFLLNHLLYCRLSQCDDDLVLGGKVFQYFWNRGFLQKNEIRFDSKLNYAEDLVFCCLAIVKARSIKVVDKSIYNYYVIKGTASRRYRENYWHELQMVYHVLTQICPEYISPGMYYQYARTAQFHIAEYAQSKTISRNTALEKFREVSSDKLLHDDFTSIKNRRWTLQEKVFNALMISFDNGRSLFYYLYLRKKLKSTMIRFKLRGGGR